MSKPSRFGKYLLIVLILGALAAAGVYYWRQRDVKPPEVTTVAVTRGDVVQSITATGILQTPTSVDISCQISGQISERLVDYNSPVKKGDVLARIDPASYESRLRQAKAQLANAKANYDVVSLSAERTRTLRAQNLVAQQDLDTIESQLVQADAQLKIQQANVENAQVDLSRCTIYSPIDGVVLDRQCDVGKTVAANFNAPTLFTIVTDLSNMEINSDVAEADIGNVSMNQEVNFTVDAFPNRTFHGRVTQIRNLPKTSQSVVVYSTIISVRNENQRLKPGMTANVSIIVAQRAGVLRVPNAALRSRVPEQFVLQAPTPSPAPGESTTPTPAEAPKPPGDRREQMRQLFQDAGFSWGGGPPTPEVIEKLKKLAAERGLELPERFGGKPRTSGEVVIQTRTLYRLASPLPKLQVEAVKVKTGVTDGSFTEVLEGLKEGETLVSSVFIPGEAAAPAAANPFGGQTAGPGGRRF